MKKLIIIICSIIMLTSCSENTYPTDEEIEAQEKICEINWRAVYIYSDYTFTCRHKETPIMDCIKEYTEWLDQKYNNPDHVTNLREDTYSEVVKTCNEVFWEKITK